VSERTVVEEISLLAGELDEIADVEGWGVLMEVDVDEAAAELVVTCVLEENSPWVEDAKVELWGAVDDEDWGGVYVGVAEAEEVSLVEEGGDIVLVPIVEVWQLQIVAVCMDVTVIMTVAVDSSCLRWKKGVAPTEVKQ
jgi:hypothetical protein